MAKVNSWLNQHKRLRAVLAWKGWAALFIVLIVLIALLSTMLYIATWFFTTLNVCTLSEDAFKRLMLLLAELRQFIDMFYKPTFVAGVMAFASLFIDKNGDHIPDVIEKGGGNNV